MPRLLPDHEIFYTLFYMKKCVFAIFQQELQNSTMFDGLLRYQISEKWANLRFPLNIQKQILSAMSMFLTRSGHFTPSIWRWHEMEGL